ncbi:MAG TPA: hypothetical protein PLP82_00100 [Deltaproteobacteria bacterium]|nr:hypothetical protein [Deltaproteobacteria bacterium]HRW80517.1 hypothetical protein [Desulfomonilia bacterium]HOC75667.1 hypothetical protein [Deltaproteobacteria bacterium]HON94676.1 hypothetical protein [Deltaproteobacteria bacterium]HOY74775.1 hypothetical protein [Deltaproteobacteria bacterium]
MKQTRSSPCPAPLNEQGWVIALVLMILAVTMGLAMASASLVLFHMKSSHAFLRIMQDTFLSTRDGGTFSGGATLLDAPEGWDHIHFSTRLTDQGVDNARTYSWRVALRNRCMTIQGQSLLPSLRPYIIVLIDDSLSMTISSGHDYCDDALYLKRPAGDITLVSACCEIADTHACARGVYFRGRWGNTNERAPSSNGLHGAMPVWTHAFSQARALIDSLDQCEVAVVSTSRGPIQQFTHDGREIMRAMNSLAPTSTEAPLAESLYHACGTFPSDCITRRHILVVTAGLPVNDGHLPAWLRDYDHDDNPADAAFDGAGSHCLDDVATYAASLGITVHVMGPDTGFLRDVAASGGGRFMPARDDLAPADTTVTAPLAMHQGAHHVLSNARACFCPAWLEHDTGPHVRQNITDPLESVSCPDIPITGIVLSCVYDESSLFCTTSRDQTIGIDIAGRDLSWLYQGVGGTVLPAGGDLVVGPGRDGWVSSLTRDGHLRWQQQGTCTDASESHVYIGTGSLLQAFTLADGFPVAMYDTGCEISVIRFDPVTGTVIAGTADGLVFLFDQDLIHTGFLSTGTGDAVIEIRPYTLHRTFHVLALSRRRLMSFTNSGLLWSVSLDEGAPVGITVMAGHIFVVVWNGAVPCLGLDSGLSTLLEFDASTGEPMSSETVCTGMAFGPSLDLENASMKFVSSGGQIMDRDISSLPGILSSPLGKKLIRQSE